MRAILEKNQEKRILMGMIMDDAFLGKIATIYRDDIFTTPYVQKMAKVVMHYYKNHGTAPRKNVEGIFLRIARKLRDEEDIEMISAMLGEISAEEVPINSQYMAEEAEEYFNAARLKTTTDDIQTLLETGDVKAATNTILSYSKIDMTSSGGIFVFENKQAWEDAFKETSEPLFYFPGAMGKFLNRYLIRDSFVGFQGGEKSGKSFMLAEVAIRALRNRRKVAVFEVGDQSQGQLLLRIGSRVTRVPIWKSDCGDYTKPIRFDGEQGGNDNNYDSFAIVTDTGHTEEPLTFNRAWDGIRKFMRRSRCTEKSFALASYPNDTCTLSDIRAQLDVWEVQNGFIPDVIIIDYADIMAAEDTKLDIRDRINSIWKGMRRLSQERHCLLATATQATRAAYTSTQQDATMLSEDKRKFSHVTGLFGLSRIIRKDNPFRGDLTRVNFIGGRWGLEISRSSVIMLQDLARGRVLIDSAFE